MSASLRFPGRVLPAVFVALAWLLAMPTLASGAARPRNAERRASAMARIPAGRYVPLYARAGSPAGAVRVDAFSLDREPVTRGEFLAFVRANPAWRRSAVPATLAERGYLAGWRSDVDAGTAAQLERPVTQVSWHAARAYCAARGGRLPTTDEWEYAAAASETVRDATRDPAFVRRLVALYGARAGRALPAVGSGFRNVYGVSDLHDLVWEWTLDFPNAPAATHAHHAADHHAGCASAAIGAADPTNYPAFLRTAVRAGLDARSTIGSLGFRCAAGSAAA